MNQNEWQVIDRTHHQRMTELGVLDQFVSPAIELASKKGVHAREKLRKHRREHNNREIRKAFLANTLQSRTLQPHACGGGLAAGSAEVRSPLATHQSPIANRHLRVATHSPLTTRSPLAPLTARHSPLAARRSRHSPLLIARAAS